MKHKFRTFMILYCMLAVIAIGFLWYKVWTLVEVYQQELPEYAMDDYMEDFQETYYRELVLANSNISINEFEDEADIISRYGNISLEEKELSYKKKTGSYTNTRPVYSVLAGQDEIAVIHLQENKGKSGRDKWSIGKEEVPGITLKGTETIVISAPEGCEVYVNEIRVADSYITGTDEEAELLRSVEKYVTDIPRLQVYTLEGFFDTPQVRAVNTDGSEMTARVEGNKYSYGFQASHTFAQENTEWIKEMSKIYALYLSNDGSFEQLAAYLYPDNSVEGLKSKLATIGVIWYTAHTATSISDQNVRDFKQYGDNCFSCVVEFKQTVNGIGGSGNQSVVNDNRLICIFVKHEGQWKWAAMNTIEIGD